MKDNFESDKGKAYLLAIATGFSWIIFFIAELNMFYHSEVIQPKIKQTLIFLIFKKISSLSQYMLNHQEVGKIINTISSDFNVIENQAYSLITILRTVFNIIGVSVILFLRLKWIGVLSVFILAFIIFIQLIIGRLNSENLKKINIEKDKRIKLYSEIIDGIKFIKINGFETTFMKMIQSLR